MTKKILSLTMLSLLLSGMPKFMFAGESQTANITFDASNNNDKKLNDIDDDSIDTDDDIDDLEPTIEPSVNPVDNNQTVLNSVASIPVASIFMIDGQWRDFFRFNRNGSEKTVSPEPKILFVSQAESVIPVAVAKPTVYQEIAQFIPVTEDLVSYKVSFDKSEDLLVKNLIEKFSHGLIKTNGSSSYQWNMQKEIAQITNVEKRKQVVDGVVTTLKTVIFNMQKNFKDKNPDCETESFAQEFKCMDTIRLGIRAIIKDSVEANEDFFVNGPSGKDWVYDTVWKEKVATCALLVAAVAVPTAIGFYFSQETAIEKIVPVDRGEGLFDQAVRKTLLETDI